MNKIFLTTLALLLCVASASWSSPPFQMDNEGLAALLCAEDEACAASIGQMGFRDMRDALVRRGIGLLENGVRDPASLSWMPETVVKFFTVLKMRMSKYPAAERFAQHNLLTEFRKLRGKVGGDAYPYFGFMPSFRGAGLLGGPSATFATSCFANYTIKADWLAENKSVLVQFSASQEIGFLCSDTFMLWGGGLGVKIETFDSADSKQFGWNVSSRIPGDHYLLTTRGVRVFHFRTDFLTLIGDVIDTVVLLSGYGQSPLKNDTLGDNVAFLTSYVQNSPRMQPFVTARSGGATVAKNINPNYINSGDSFIVVRYDGLDPMIGWGEGFTAGHSTIAIRFPGKGLHVCESTTKDAYWPTNGIQCTPWQQWIAQAEAAQFHVLLAPLAPKYAQAFNVTAAIEFFEENIGVNYGYLNFLFGWVDRRSSNFPCLPPDFKTCLDEEFVEIIAVAIDKVGGGSPENVFRQAMNHRVGTFNLSVPDVLKVGADQGLKNISDIYTIVEQDEWRYHTLRNGTAVQARSMVCCVFVCHMWKHAGIFSGINNQINCAEQTLWDIYSMQLYDPAKLGKRRPNICKVADPNNQLCQLMGTQTFHAKPDFNTRPLYAHMGEHCSSQAPEYIREPGC